MQTSGIGQRSALGAELIADTRRRLGDLKRQLATGEKAETHGGVGLGRGLALGLQARQSRIASYTQTMDIVDVRTTTLQTTLRRIDGIGRETQQATGPVVPFALAAGNQTWSQRLTRQRLDEMLSLLNTRADDRYIFGGRVTDQPPVIGMDTLINGDPATGRAGLAQVITERANADLGTPVTVDGVARTLGRLSFSTPFTAGTDTTFSIAESASPNAFGLKIAGATTTFGNATVTNTAGPPASFDVSLTGQPQAGQNFVVEFNFPDGSSERLTLLATTSTTPGTNEVQIGANTAATAANLRTKLAERIDFFARSKLAAASAVQAGREFFGDPPVRVDTGANPPIATRDGSADTVAWYRGEPDTVANGPARDSATARIDETVNISYGVRASEEALRWQLTHVAVMATTTFSNTDATSQARYEAMTQRVEEALDPPPAGIRRIQSIEVEIVAAQRSMQRTRAIQRETNSSLEGMLQSIRGVSLEETSAKVLALQTQLQASLQTTALVSRVSLINYL